MEDKDKFLCQYSTKRYTKSSSHPDQLTEEDESEEAVMNIGADPYFSSDDDLAETLEKLNLQNDKPKSSIYRNISLNKRMAAIKPTPSQLTQTYSVVKKPDNKTKHPLKVKINENEIILSSKNVKSKTPVVKQVSSRKVTSKEKGIQKQKPSTIMKKGNLSKESSVRDSRTGRYMSKNYESLYKMDVFKHENYKIFEAKTIPNKIWIRLRKPTVNKLEPAELKKKTMEDILKTLFLVDMPKDFYQFFEFCKSIDNEEPKKALEEWGLNLVGPYDILAGNTNYPTEKRAALCHWRFYYDPPEFQTVLTTESGFHIGYWRDDPRANPVFLASNSGEDCVFKVEGDNIFSAVIGYLENFSKNLDPFKKLRISQLQSSITEFAQEERYSIDPKPESFSRRQKMVVTKTLHKIGIVVPEIGYRPLMQTEENITKMCTLIRQEGNKTKREALIDNLQAIITDTDLANDNCEIGNRMELGMNLFCTGSPAFHNLIERLLCNAYSLLDRSEFEEIIRAHVNNRRKGTNLSAF